MVLQGLICCLCYDQSRQHFKKQRHYFANKGPSSQSYGFPSSHAWMWELDYKRKLSTKNWCFQLWCWRRLLRVPWTARRSNQLILKGISPEYSLEKLMLKLKFQYFGNLMWRTDSLEKTLLLGKIESKRRRGWQRMRWLGDITDLMDMSFSKLQELGWTGKPCVLPSMRSQRVRHHWETEQNWIKRKSQSKQVDKTKGWRLDSDITQMLELLGRKFKITNINMLRALIESIQEQMHTINREIAVLRIKKKC